MSHPGCLAKRVIDVVLASAALLVLGAARWSSRSSIRLETPRPPDLPPAARRPRRRAVRALQAAHDGLRRRARWAPASPSTRATTASRASARCCAALDRRAAEPRQRAARRDVARRPAPDGAGAGRPLHRPPARPPVGAARASPAGRRSTAARRCRGTSGSSSTSGTSSTSRSRSTCASCGGRCGWCVTGHGLYRGETGGWREPPKGA